MDLVQPNDSLNHHKAFDFVTCVNKPTNKGRPVIRTYKKTLLILFNINSLDCEKGDSEDLSKLSMNTCGSNEILYWTLLITH